MKRNSVSQPNINIISDKMVLFPMASILTFMGIRYPLPNFKLWGNTELGLMICNSVLQRTIYFISDEMVLFLMASLLTCMRRVLDIH